MVRLPVLLCISFCFAIGVSIMSMQLGLLCNDDGLCEWKRNTLYNGYLSEDATVLKFVYFDASSHAVLSCTSVQVVYIEYTEMTCNEISAVFTTLRPFQYKSATRRAWVLTINHKWFRVTWKGRWGGVSFIFIFFCMYYKHVVNVLLFIFIGHFPLSYYRYA